MTAPTASRASRGSSRSPTTGSSFPSARAQLAKVMAAGGGFDSDIKYGTIGAVAVDQAGHVAAATSTGGLTAKRWGRIGDSPLIGAGTYADDRAAAVSATGLGETFMRAAAAHELCARMRLGGEGLQAGARRGAGRRRRAGRQWRADRGRAVGRGGVGLHHARACIAPWPAPTGATVRGVRRAGLVAAAELFLERGQRGERARLPPPRSPPPRAARSAALALRG